ncbi:MAG: DUF4912 domain-containing protein [Planctomycetia bacterium]|nr:DUF4912 domain-containing protein [Planctomycetia bacterium]
MTKPELVRALLRMAQSKRPASRAGTRARTAELSLSRSRNGRKPSKRHHKNGSNGSANGHVLPLKIRDLCTTEGGRRNGSGRKNYIDATVSDAHWIRVQWDLTRDSIRRAESRLGVDWHTAVPTLRLLGVAVDDVNSVSEGAVKDVVIEAGVNTWYVHVPTETRAYRIHIGYKTRNGLFFALAKSNVCTLPALNANLAPGLNGQHSANGEEAQAVDAGDNKATGRLGRPLGFSTLSHFGPAATEEREKGEFSFTLDTELIVHGATRPGSMLTVQGNPVELRDDGSFTIRVNQPEGRQVVAFTAMSPRGSERRMIVLGVERNTKELERQYFDGGHPEDHVEM